MFRIRGNYLPNSFPWTLKNYSKNALCSCNKTLSIFSFRRGVHHPGLPVQRWAGNLLRGGPPLLEGTALLQIWGLILHRYCGTALRQLVNRSARPPSPGGLKGRQSPLGGLIICKLTDCHLRQQGSERGRSDHSELPGLGNCSFKTSTWPPTPLQPSWKIKSVQKCP